MLLFYMLVRRYGKNFNPPNNPPEKTLFLPLWGVQVYSKNSLGLQIYSKGLRIYSLGL